MPSSLIIGPFIGDGAYGAVYHARWAMRRVAIKKFKLTRSEARQAAAIQQEIDVLEKLRDKHVIQFYGTTYHDDNLVLVMEFAEGGNLCDAIEGGRLPDWSTKQRIAQEMVRGLAYIHYENILHRDLKSANVLLTKHLEVKLADFGLAMVKVRSASTSTGRTRDSGMLKGTLRWMAPELFSRKPAYSTKSDMYALAMVMWEMAANCTTPFQDQFDNAIIATLIDRGEREDIPAETPTEYREWIERCWDQDPNRRPEARHLVDEDFEEASFLGIGAGSQGSGRGLSTVDITEDVLYAALTSPPTTNPNEVSDISDSSITNLKSSGSDEISESPDVTSFHWQLTERGNAEAWIKVGIHCEEGWEASKNTEEACKWYRQAVEKGHSQSQTLTTSCTTCGYTSNPLYDGTVVFDAKHKPDLLLAKLQSHIGCMYQHGYGVDVNLEEAISWYHKAAKQGDVNAQRSLAVMYRDGLGLGQSDTEAMAWFLQAADQGDAEAHNEIGLLYQHGRGVEASDHTEAMAWYTKAAKQDHPAGQRNLGWMYRNGQGIVRDYEKALFWSQLAADRGDSAAQLMVAKMLENGEGGPINLREAHFWYTKAAEQGNIIAQTRLQTFDQPQWWDFVYRLVS